MTKVVPHPKAPTIDHIVPLSAGGDDTKANVQLACFLCNSIKGSRGTQQLTLIG
jgi:5-methylcytosine-specific restriction endonuclease McrA